jgi:histidyl-tRNA synthetase
MDSLFKEYLQLDETQAYTLAKLIDRMHKMDYAAFVGETDLIFTPSQRESGKSDQLFAFLKATAMDEIPDGLKTHPSADDLRTLLNSLDRAGIHNAQFDASLMRGFDYYTDIVFEVFDNHPENNRSMFGGGRYDGLVGLFGVEPVPTVGFGAGDVTLENFLLTHELLPELRSETDLYAILIGDVVDPAQAVIKELREMGVNVAADFTGRKADKQLKTALKKGINYVLFIGEKELAEEQYVLKNLKTGEEERHGVQRIVSIVKDYRQQ